MYQSELMHFTILAILILFSPFLPTCVLLLLDNVLIRFALVLILLYLINIGPTAGIFGLMMVSLLYLERNRRKVSIATKQIDLMDWTKPENATTESSSLSQTTVPVNEFDTPNENTSYYIPSDNYDNDIFEPVAPTINEKSVLQSIYPLNNSGSGTNSDKVYEDLGFGHIDGLERN